MTDDSRHEGAGPADPRRRQRWGVWVALVLIGLLLVIQIPIYRSMAMGLLGIGPPDDGIAWRTDFAAAQAEAAEAGKPMLINFTADWCGPCVAMKRDTWPGDGVRETVLDGYVPVRLDVDTREGKRIGRRYAVGSLPTNMIVNAQGDELTRATGYLSADDLRDWIAPYHR